MTSPIEDFTMASSFGMMPTRDLFCETRPARTSSLSPSTGSTRPSLAASSSRSFGPKRVHRTHSKCERRRHLLDDLEAASSALFHLLPDSHARGASGDSNPIATSLDGEERKQESALHLRLSLRGRLTLRQSQRPLFACA